MKKIAIILAIIIFGLYIIFTTIVIVIKSKEVYDLIEDIDFLESCSTVEPIATDSTGEISVTEIFMEVLKKKNLTLPKVQLLFTFDSICIVQSCNKNDLLWTEFDFKKIDTNYIKDFDAIFVLNSFPLFLLFKDNNLVDYRYIYSNRNHLMSKLSRHYALTIPITYD